MKVFIIISLSLLVVSGCTHTSVRNRKDRALLHLKMGTGHLTKGNYPLALADLQKAEELDEENVLIQNNLGLAYLVQDQLVMAEHHLRKALKIRPSYTEARNNLGRVLIEQSSFKEAIEELKIATHDLTYQNPERALSNLGIAYFKNSEFELALSCFKRSLKIKPDTCTTNTLYGRSFYELKQYSQAALALDKSIPFCKKMKFDEPNYYSALSYFKMGNREESLARLDELLKNYPKGRYVEKAKDMLEIVR